MPHELGEILIGCRGQYRRPLGRAGATAAGETRPVPVQQVRRWRGKIRTIDGPERRALRCHQIGDPLAPFGGDTTHQQIVITELGRGSSEGALTFKSGGSGALILHCETLRPVRTPGLQKRMHTMSLL